MINLLEIMERLTKMDNNEKYRKEIENSLGDLENLTFHATLVRGEEVIDDIREINFPMALILINATFRQYKKEQILMMSVGTTYWIGDKILVSDKIRKIDIFIDTNL